MCEEGLDKAWPPAEAIQGEVELLMQLFQVAAGEVAHLDVLEVVPAPVLQLQRPQPPPLTSVSRNRTSPVHAFILPPRKLDLLYAAVSNLLQLANREVAMWKSPSLEEARRQGRLEARHLVIPIVLRSRFGVEPPSELISLVESTTDEHLLLDWYDFAFNVESIDAMLARVRADRFAPPGF